MLKNHAPRQVFVLFALALSLFAAGCPEPITQNMPYTIDPTIQPMEATRASGTGERWSVAAVADDEGTITSFVEDQVLIRPADSDELNRFLSQTGGTVVSHDGLPNEVNGFVVPVGLRAPTTYVVRVNTASLSLDNFSALAGAALGTDRPVRISSEAAAKLLTLIVTETVNGLDVAPNLVFTPSYIFDAIDGSDPETAAPWNTFRYFPFIHDTNGSGSGMTAAWSLFSMHPEVTRLVKVAVIDGGFYVDVRTGEPRGRDAMGRSDYRIRAGATAPLQYNTDNDTGQAGGPSEVNCSGGTPCPWHGHNAAITATGLLGNGYGMAGTGGQVGEPILIKSNLTTGSVKRGLRMAQAMGAEIVNMSFSGECDNVFCEFYYSAERYSSAYWDAYRSGMALFAAAGNSGWDARNTIPCRFNGAVFCVGAMNRDDNNAASYSNFGSNVDLFAPTGIPVWSPVDDGTSMFLDSYSGTSAATPYVAGVAAMLRAIRSEFTPDQVYATLRDTARRDSPDPKVSHYLSAINAVRTVFGNRLPEDMYEPNNSTAAPTERSVSSPGTFGFGDVTLHSSTDVDYYLFHVSDWVGAEIGILRPDAVTDISAVLTRIGAGGPPRQTNYQYFTNVKSISYTGLYPGDYLLTVRAGASSRPARETEYNASVVFIDEESPNIPDAFENNNSLGFAANLGSRRGTWRVNHHNSSDSDFYRFDVGSFIGRESMTFAIRSSDFPLNLTVYDSTGAEVVPEASHREISSLGTGTWTVRVRQPMGLRGHYTFTAMGAVPVTPEQSGSFAPRPRSFWEILIALSTLDLSVIRGAEYLLVPTGPRPDEFTILGAVDADLFDMDGGLISNGVPVPDGQGNFNTRISMAGAPATEAVVIQVRARGMDMSLIDAPEFSDATFSEVPFIINWDAP